MDVKKLVIRISELEREKKQMASEMEMLKSELQKINGEKTEIISEDKVADNATPSGISEYVLERGKHYFGNQVILPDDAAEEVDWLYEVTNGKVTEDDVVFLLDEWRFGELHAMNGMLSSLLLGAPLVTVKQCLVFFCQDMCCILEPDEEEEEYNLAAMFRYNVIKQIFRFDDGLRIDVTEDARKYEDYNGDLHRLPKMDSQIEKHIPRILLNLRDYEKK